MKQLTLIAFVLTVIFLGLAAYFLLGIEQPDPLPEEIEVIEVEQLDFGELPAALRLTVLETGMVAIPQSTIASTNLPYSSFSAEFLSLTRDGQPIPFHISTLDPNNPALYFYGEALTDTLDAPAVYMLTIGAGVSMDTRTSTQTESNPNEDAGIGQQVIRLEENTTFLQSALGDDVWLGPLIWGTAPVSITLDSIQPAASGAATLRTRLWSNNAAPVDPDHHLIISINEAPVIEEYWDGIASVTFEADVSGKLDPSSNNILNFFAPGDLGALGEAIYIDWVELTFNTQLRLDGDQLAFRSNEPNVLVSADATDVLIFDVSNPEAPVVLDGFSSDGEQISFANEDIGGDFVVLEPSSAIQPQVSVAPQRETALRDQSGADYVAIVPDNGRFREALEPLIEFRQEQGLSTAIVSAEQIYDEFAGGRQSAEALRDFILFSAESWTPAPQFVLLVGDATYDVYDFEEGKNRNLLPTQLIYTEYAGYVASDTWLSTPEGELEPVVALGRFPVQNSAQLISIVQKTLDYEQSVDSDYLSKALLVADDEARFDIASDTLGDSLAESGFDNQKLYMSIDENIHDDIIAALNEGVGLVNYVGHGSVRVWGDERVFQVDDVESLTNEDRYPIFTTFTCLNGYFNHPEEDSLAEVLLWAEGGGIVASVAPSGRTTTAQQEPLAFDFFNSLLTQQFSTLGEALQFAKSNSADNPRIGEVIHTFNLLGDPALKLHLPQVQN